VAQPVQNDRLIAVILDALHYQVQSECRSPHMTLTVPFYAGAAALKQEVAKAVVPTDDIRYLMVSR
jgi:hypothetical protein